MPPGLSAQAGWANSWRTSCSSPLSPGNKVPLVPDFVKEQLLAQERELDSREGAVIAWDEGLMVFARALGEASTECNTSRARVDAVRRDFSAQVCTSSSWYGQLNALSRLLEEHASLLCLEETDLEVHEAVLEEELERGLHPPDRWDLSVELDKAHASVDRSTDDLAAEAE
jgi:hypothetical protein